MLHRELNKANAAERMATKFAFGVIYIVALLVEELWLHLSRLDKFNTCQWHSACAKFGHLNNLITLSGTRL